MLNLKDMIHYFVEHRHDVVIRRTQFELRKGRGESTYLRRLILHRIILMKLIKASKKYGRSEIN
jgi:DNA gyrase subunit A